MTDRQSFIVKRREMARVIDKQQKKREIALSALPVFAQEGFSSVSVERIAKAAGVGKGTIYLYFESKDEVVLEIWSSLREQHFEYMNHLSGLVNCSDKIIGFFDFEQFVQEEELSKLLKLFFEYLGSILLSHNEKFIEHFRVICEEDFKTIHGYIEEGIAKGEFKDVDAKTFAYTIIHLLKGTIVHAKGMGYDASKTNKEIVKVMSNLLSIIKKDEK